MKNNNLLLFSFSTYAIILPKSLPGEIPEFNLLTQKKQYEKSIALFCHDGGSNTDVKFLRSY